MDRHRRSRIARITSIAVLVTVLVPAANATRFAAARVSSTISPLAPFVIGPYRDVHGGADVVIGGSATIYPPNHFITAILHITGPGNPLGQFQGIKGPASFVVANFTVSGLDGGTYSTYIEWQTSGLGGSVVTSPAVTFAVPYPPTLPRFTPQQKQDLTNVSNALWKAGAYIAAAGAIAALAVLVIGTGGLAGAGVAFAFGICGGSLAAWMAADASDLSADPARPLWQQLPPVSVPSLGMIVASPFVSAAAAAAANALLKHQAQEMALVDAVNVAIDRAAAAQAAGDSTWEAKQLRVAKSRASQAASLLSSELLQRSKVRAELIAGGFPQKALTASQYAQAQQQILTKGLPASWVHYLLSIHAPARTTDQLRGSLTLVAPAQAAGPVLNVLAPPVGHSSPILTALTHLAADLQQFARS